MFEVWNFCDNEAPPLCNVKTVIRKSEIMDLISVLSDACATYDGLKVFNVEAAILARFLYMIKRIFRQDKGIQLLTKVKQAVDKFRAHSAIGPIKRLKRCFPEKILPDGRIDHLPTRQQLKWVLLSLLSNAKLFVRMIDLCKAAGRYIYGRLSIGWSASNMLFALALNSRILICAKYMLIKTVEWYDRLRIHLPVLVETNTFLNDYEFPNKMEDFIGYIDLKPPTKRPDIDKIFELIDLTRGEENDEDDDIILLNEINNIADSDDEIVVTSDDIIVEKERITTKGKKRVRDDVGDDVAVLCEHTKRSAPSLVPFQAAVDIGEPVPRKKRRLKHRGGQSAWRKNQARNN